MITYTVILDSLTEKELGLLGVLITTCEPVSHPPSFIKKILDAIEDARQNPDEN